MSKIDTLIFDMDGTLLDTLEDLKNSVVYVQKKYGYPLHTMDQVRAHVGNGIANLVAKSIPQGKENPLSDSIEKEFREHYDLHCNDNTRPYPGILELLMKLKEQGYKMAIVSNKGDSAVKALNLLHFSQFISTAIGENEAAGVRRKPAPDTVFTALKELDSDKEHAVYVGDSEVDILTARNSGMPVILCEWGFREKDYLLSQGGKYFAKKPLDVISVMEHF